jgi:cytochrome c oxidase subunit 2
VQQHALEPAGPQADDIAALWWIAFWIAVVVFAAVCLAFGYAAFHRGNRSSRELAVDTSSERQSTRWVALATASTVVVLFAFLIIDLIATRELGALQRDQVLRVRVTGEQWWWRIEYQDSMPQRVFQTANELHIPVGRTVELDLATNDVIHSFWVPALAGKRDMIPGQQNRLWIRADRAGRYRGECAEYCGLQHAKMGVVVIAHEPRDFDAWYAAQLAPAAMPADSVRKIGHDVFVNRSCTLCHQIRGTQASAQVGPDLTHIGSRTTLAAATIPNTRGHLGGWITNPQGVKPGTRMPRTKLEARELHALLAYLEGLR